MAQKLVVCINDGVYGRPAAGVAVRIEKATAEGWTVTLTGATDDDGRWTAPLASVNAAGGYRFAVESGSYYSALGLRALATEVIVAVPLHRDGGVQRLSLTLVPCGHALFAGV